jgi:hypothetical protein
LSDYNTYVEGAEPSSPQGLVQWSAVEQRLPKLQSFAQQFEPSQNWKNFDVQLLWILRELRTTQTTANKTLLRTTKIDTGKGACSVFLRYYVKAGSDKLDQSVSYGQAIFETLYSGG